MMHAAEQIIVREEGLDLSVEDKTFHIPRFISKRWYLKRRKITLSPRPKLKFKGRKVTKKLKKKKNKRLKFNTRSISKVDVNTHQISFCNSKIVSKKSRKKKRIKKSVFQRARFVTLCAAYI